MLVQGRGTSAAWCGDVETTYIKLCSPPTPIYLMPLSSGSLRTPAALMFLDFFSPRFTSRTKTAKLIFAYFPVFCLLHSDKLSGLEEIFWTSDIERAWKYLIPLFNPTFTKIITFIHPTFRYGNEDRLWQQGKVFKIFIFDLWLQIV